MNEKLFKLAAEISVLLQTPTPEIKILKPSLSGNAAVAASVKTRTIVCRDEGSVNSVYGICFSMWVMHRTSLGLKGFDRYEASTFAYVYMLAFHKFEFPKELFADEEWAQIQVLKWKMAEYLDQCWKALH